MRLVLRGRKLDGHAAAQARIATATHRGHHQRDGSWPPPAGGGWVVPEPRDGGGPGHVLGCAGGGPDRRLVRRVVKTSAPGLRCCWSCFGGHGWWSPSACFDPETQRTVGSRVKNARVPYRLAPASEFMVQTTNHRGAGRRAGPGARRPKRRTPAPPTSKACSEESIDQTPRAAHPFRGWRGLLMARLLQCGLGTVKLVRLIVAWFVPTYGGPSRAPGPIALERPTWGPGPETAPRPSCASKIQRSHGSEDRGGPAGPAATFQPSRPRTTSSAERQRRSTGLPGPGGRCCEGGRGLSSLRGGARRHTGLSRSRTQGTSWSEAISSPTRRGDRRYSARD